MFYGFDFSTRLFDSRLTSGFAAYFGRIRAFHGSRFVALGMSRFFIAAATTGPGRFPQLRVAVRHRPLKYDAIELLASRWNHGINAMQFGQKFRQIAKAVRLGIGLCQFGNITDQINTLDQHLSQAGSVADLSFADDGARPEAQRLAFFSLANQIDKMFFQQQHDIRINRQTANFYGPGRLGRSRSTTSAITPNADIGLTGGPRRGFLPTGQKKNAGRDSSGAG